ncbi:hypothetical protein HJC99_05675 [Candidatus Saccharibacteria bacterium]|nr:hypothetical protein [Candidatus Saccharibacteria bacterium]
MGTPGRTDYYPAIATPAEREAATDRQKFGWEMMSWDAYVAFAWVMDDEHPVPPVPDTFITTWARPHIFADGHSVTIVGFTATASIGWIGANGLEMIYTGLPTYFRVRVPDVADAIVMNGGWSQDEFYAWLQSYEPSALRA